MQGKEAWVDSPADTADYASERSDANDNQHVQHVSRSFVAHWRWKGKDFYEHHLAVCIMKENTWNAKSENSHRNNNKNWRKKQVKEQSF